VFIETTNAPKRDWVILGVFTVFTINKKEKRGGFKELIKHFRFV